MIHQIPSPGQIDGITRFIYSRGDMLASDEANNILVRYFVGFFPMIFFYLFLLKKCCFYAFLCQIRLRCFVIVFCFLIFIYFLDFIFLIFFNFSLCNLFHTFLSDLSRITFSRLNSVPSK